MQEKHWEWRLLVRGSFTDRWRAASEEERAEVFDSWIIVHKAWQELGCRLIATIDDVTLIGTPNAGEWNFYAIWEIPTPELIYDLTIMFWPEGPQICPVNLSDYFALEATIGKPIVTMEQQLGGPQLATLPGA